MKKRVTIPLYGGSFIIHLTENFEKTLVDVGYGGDLECDAAIIYDSSRNFDIIFKVDRIQHGLIAHESFHLTMRIMKHINKPYDVCNDEPEAYLIQFITSEIYRFIKANNLTIKK